MPRAIVCTAQRRGRVGVARVPDELAVYSPFTLVTYSGHSPQASSASFTVPPTLAGRVCAEGTRVRGRRRRPLATAARVKAAHHLRSGPQLQLVAMTTAGGVGSAGNPNEPGLSKSLTAVETTLSACSGAAITTLFVTPFDVVKTRLQVNNQGPECSCCSSERQSSALLRIVRHEGVRSLWSGLQPTLLMQVPGTVLYFTVYEAARDAVAARSPQSLQEYSPLVAGGGARLITSTVVSPLELMRTRMQAEQALLRQGMLGGAVALVRREGVAALWKGLAPTLWRDVPFSMVYWLGYESLKR